MENELIYNSYRITMNLGREKMKKFLASFLVLLAVVALAACGGKDNEKAANELQQIKDDGKITIGLEGTFPPFSYHDKDGKLTGFEYEIATQIAKDLGVEAEFVEVKWDSLIAGLDTKKYDFVINNISITDERKAKYDFTTPYMKSEAVLAVRDNSSIQTLKDYKGKKSAQTVTSNFAGEAEKLGATIVPNENLTQSIDLVKQKRADGTIHDRVTFLTYMKENPESGLRVIDDVISSTDIAILLNQDQPEFKAELDKIITKNLDNGTFAKISEKYFNENVMYNK